VRRKILLYFKEEIMRLRRILVFALSLCFMFSTFSFSDEGPPREILNAAQEGIDSFLKKIELPALYDVGFKSQEDVDNAAIGDGFQIFTIPPERLLNEDVEPDLSILVIPMDMWQFLVRIPTRIVSLITIDRMKGNWKPVSIGSAGLAEQLGIFLEAWPQTQGYSYRLIRVYQAKSDYMEVFSGETSLGLVPLTSARVAMELEDRAFNPADLHDPEEVMKMLRPIVSENIRVWEK
jgi:hypothetical protein